MISFKGKILKFQSNYREEETEEMHQQERISISFSIENSFQTITTHEEIFDMDLLMMKFQDDEKEIGFVGKNLQISALLISSLKSDPIGKGRIEIQVQNYAQIDAYIMIQNENVKIADLVFKILIRRQKIPIYCTIKQKKSSFPCGRQKVFKIPIPPAFQIQKEDFSRFKHCPPKIENPTNVNYYSKC